MIVSLTNYDLAFNLVYFKNYGMTFNFVIMNNYDMAMNNFEQLKIYKYTNIKLLFVYMI